MFNIRHMRQEDIGAIVKIEQECFSTPWTMEGFFDSLGLDYAVSVVAEEYGKLLGYGGIYFTAEEGEITNVAVMATERRRGIADALLKQIDIEAKNRNVTKIFLEVRVSNEAALQLYQRHGYKLCGTRKNFYRLPQEDAYVMCKE